MNRSRPVSSRLVVSWLGWHAGEFAALTVLVVLAVTVTRWAWLLAAAVAVAWLAHELDQQHRRRHAERQLPALPAHPETHPGLPVEESATSESVEVNQEVRRHG